MSEIPVVAVRNKPESSIVKTAQLGGRRAEKRADIIISAGNTGACVSAATMNMRRLPGIHRPGIACAIPTFHGPVVLCDVGANPEPIGLAADMAAGVERLLARLCRALEARGVGARSLRLTARRVDGADAEAELTLARPLREPARLAALLQPRAAEIDAGHGIDALRLEATAVEPLRPAQADPAQGEPAEAAPAPGNERLADLLSRLGNRIGFEHLIRLLPAESHIPERAFIRAAAAWSTPEPFPAGGPPRPLVLFPPEPVTPGTPGSAAAPPPARPPERFRWRGRRLTLARADGPERLAPEWWWHDPAWESGTRDYWRVETAEGPRLWLFHTPEAARPAWFAQGAFA